LVDIKNEYDAIVIGSGLAGMTAANMLAKSDNRVLLCEHHFNLGGLATWFNRKGGHYSGLRPLLWLLSNI
jgi:phytoene dehydrogenase-like protein